MATIELCFPVTIPAELWQTAGALTEEGEAALQALGAALDATLRRGNTNAHKVLTAYGMTYPPDGWATRWPGPEGAELPRPGAEGETEDDSI